MEKVGFFSLGEVFMGIGMGLGGHGRIHATDMASRTNLVKYLYSNS